MAADDNENELLTIETGILIQFFHFIYKNSTTMIRPTAVFIMHVYRQRKKERKTDGQFYLLPSGHRLRLLFQCIATHFTSSAGVASTNTDNEDIT